MSDNLARLTIVVMCITMLGNTKGINAIPRRDDSKPPAPFEIRAAEAYEDGRILFGQAKDQQAKAGEAGSNRQRQRFQSKAQKRYRDAIVRLQAALELLGEADEQAPPYLHDLHLRLADAFLATGDAAAARAAIGRALEQHPDDLATLYALARIELAQSDLDAVRQTYLRLLNEAEVYGAAWNYVDQLLVLMKRAVKQTAEAQRDTGFEAWLNEQAELAATTVRWSTLPD